MVATDGATAGGPSNFFADHVGGITLAVASTTAPRLRGGRPVAVLAEAQTPAGCTSASGAAAERGDDLVDRGGDGGEVALVDGAGVEVVGQAA